MELSFAVLTGKNRLWILQLLLRPYERTTKKCLCPPSSFSFIALLLSWTSSTGKNWPPKNRNWDYSRFFFHRGANFKFLFFLSVSSVTRERTHHASLRPFVNQRYNKIWSSQSVKPTRLNLSSPLSIIIPLGINNRTRNNRPFPDPVLVLFVTLCSITDKTVLPTVGWKRSVHQSFHQKRRGKRDEGTCLSIRLPVTVFSPVSRRI